MSFHAVFLRIAQRPSLCASPGASRLLGAALLVSLLGLVGCTAHQSPPAAVPDASESTADRGAMHQNPPVLQPVNGVHQLRAGLSKIRIDGQDYCLRTYNGMLPGPTLEVDYRRSAERGLRLDVTNSLARTCMGKVGAGASDGRCFCEGENCYDFNSTNFHTHGLHVRPDINANGTMLSDHVLMHLNHDSAMAMRDHGGAPLPPEACGQTPLGHRCRYLFSIDEGSRYVPGRLEHEPGTFWYHAHVHGATAMQLANGMAGALLIRGPVDRIPAIARATEQVMVLQQIPYEAATPIPPGESCDPQRPEHYSINAFGNVTSAKRTLINGRLAPRISMKAGEVQRWRMIQGGITQEILLTVEGPVRRGGCRRGETNAGRLDLQEIAVDGITMVKARHYREKLRLDPGYRSDVMIKMPRFAPTGSEFCVVDSEGRSLQEERSSEPRNLLAVIEVDGKVEEMSLPSDRELAAIAKPPMDCDEPMPPARTTIFNQQGDCEVLNIDCKLFPYIKFGLRLDDTERWDLKSGRGPHPFHIHVNPFTVCKERGEKLAQPYWRDTLLLEGDHDYEIRSRYLGFTGNFVLHCHRLDHEDRGMMALVGISGTEDSP